MRVAFIANTETSRKKTSYEIQMERSMVVVANQRIKDKKKAEALFKKQLQNIEYKLKKLGL